ncbi:hypothetical protein [Brachybacterium huguangmaarense]
MDREPVTAPSPAHSTRRRALALGAGLLALPFAGALAGCDRGTDDPTFADPSTAVPAARALLDDAQAALDDAFGPLTWEEPVALSCEEGSDGSIAPLPPRVTDTYLGKDAADIPRIAEALTAALAKHGLPPAPAPEGSDGGWLVTSSQGPGLRLEFRAKGTTELAVTAFVTGGCPDLAG